MILDRKKIIILAVLCLALISFLIFARISSNNKSPKRTVVTINKDTGQTIITDPNKTPENVNGNQFVVILGADKLLSAGLTQAQFNSIEQNITIYANSQLAGKYSRVSLLNEGFTSDGNNIHSKMRLGDSSKLLNVTIVSKDLTSYQLTIKDPAGDPKYNYDSGSVSVKNYGTGVDTTNGTNDVTNQ